MAEVYSAENRFKAGGAVFSAGFRKSINQNGPTEQHYDEGAGPLTLTGSRVTSAGSVLAFHYRNRSAVKSTRHTVTRDVLLCRRLSNVMVVQRIRGYFFIMRCAI